MRAEIWVLSAASLALVLAPIVRLLYRIARAVLGARRWSAADRAALAAGLALLALALFRPHRDVFQALDASAFRNMARAFIAGRGFHDRDMAFEALPPELRPWVLMDARAFETGERATRDRSFQIDAPDRPITRPYFYPLLALNLAGLGAGNGGRWMDYFVPAVSFAFWAAFLLVLGGRAGGPGVVLGVALAAASPLPAWLGRGCHLEAVAAALLGLATLHWLARPSGGGPPSMAGFAVGLAVSYHPIMILPAVPIGIGLLASCENRRERCRLTCAGLLGVAPLFAMTAWICAPYGGLQWSAIRNAVFHNPFIRPAAALLALCVAALGAGLALRPMRWWRALVPPASASTAFALMLVWAAPALAAALGAAGRDLAATVGRGWQERIDGLQGPAAALTLALLWIAARRPGGARERWIVTAAALTFPVFLHLKALEPMGLWSQRRLLASWLLLVAAVGPAGAAALAGPPAALLDFRSARALLLGGAVLAGLANPLRWPAPYRVQFDRNADALVERVDAELKDATVFFEYHTHSLPFAVLPGRRVYGLNSAAAPALPAIAAWIRERCRTETVLWVTAAGNPGVEDGVLLRPLGLHTAALDRVRARTALPALPASHGIRMELLRVEPLAPGAPAALDIVFESGAGGGPDRPQLGLRGPWGRGGLRMALADGGERTGRWTRAGSAVIGPVPAPGGAVRITIEGAAARRDGRTHQIVAIVPPWDGPPLELRVEQGFTQTAGVLRRPERETDGEPTGRYRIEGRWPYDPAAAGIRGFDADLGVLLHRLRIESLPAAGAAPATP